jgi:hypothetical protein
MLKDVGGLAYRLRLRNRRHRSAAGMPGIVRRP